MSSRVQGYLSWTDAHSVINSDKEMNMVSKYFGKYVLISWWQKNLAEELYVRKMPERDERKRTRKCAFWVIFCQMLHNGLKRMQKKFKNDLEHFTFLRAHVNARTNAYAQICARFFIWNWPDRVLILIHDKYEWKISFPLWRYDHKLIFTKWRLDDVTMTLSLWKVTQL